MDKKKADLITDIMDLTGMNNPEGLLGQTTPQLQKLFKNLTSKFGEKSLEEAYKVKKDTPKKVLLDPVGGMGKKTSTKKHGGKITYRMHGGQVVDAGYD